MNPARGGGQERGGGGLARHLLALGGQESVVLAPNLHTQ